MVACPSGVVMSQRIRTAGLAGAIISAAFVLTGCITPYEGRPATCDGDPNHPNWPYCHGAEPGGSQPRDFPDRI